MKITLFVLKFLFIGALFLVSNGNLHLIDPVDRATFYDMFYTWLGNLFDQAGQISGYVVNSEWLPQNESPPVQTIRG